MTTQPLEQTARPTVAATRFEIATDAIPRRRELSREVFLREHVATNRPVILEGAAAQWPGRWTFAQLREHYGDRRVTAEGLDEKTAATWHQPTADKTLAEVIDSILEGSRHWRLRSFTVPFGGIHELEQEFAAHDTLGAMLPDGLAHDAPILWMHPAGNYSPLHNDVDVETLNIQIEGRKEFLLVDPARYSSMYPRTVMTSPVDPFQLDRARYPRFTDVRPMIGTTAPGDVVFIPKYWWHAVRSLEASLNVSIHAPDTSRRRRWDALRGVPLAPRTAMAILDLPTTWLGRRVLEAGPALRDLVRRAREGVLGA